LPAFIAIALNYELQPQLVLVIGLILFGVVFAINSAVHSYLIVAWSEYDKVSMNVGFYYMANAGGRLAGTVLSGLIYQTQGLVGCLVWSSIFVFIAALLSMRLPKTSTEMVVQQS
jgi:predicted MFS family arabinose efflux permease